MQGVKLIGVLPTSSYFPYQSPHIFPSVPREKLQITQIAERFNTVEEFIPMSSLNLNVNAVEFTPTVPLPHPHTSSILASSSSNSPFDSAPISTTPQSAAISSLSEETGPKPYTIEEIFSVFQEFTEYEEFKKLDSRLANFAHRKNQVFRVLRRGNSQSKKSKKEFVRNEEFRPAEMDSWRKAKSLEEEKIRKQAIGTTLKLNSIKDDKEKVKRKIKVTLNKLSPTNLTKLKPELLTLAKDSRTALAYLIETIFEKSWAEIKYTAMYAELCKSLKEEFEGFLYDGESPSKRNQNWFRYSLLNHLQSVFEDSLDSPTKSAEEKAMLHKKKYQGSVRFIGELLKVGIVTVGIIQQIVESLIMLKERDPMMVDEEKLEVACVLISTAGGVNENFKLKEETDKIFAYLEEILKGNDRISSKVKFMIMNLVDERAAGWVKDVSEQPKTVEEIRSEFQSEHERKKY